MAAARAMGLDPETERAVSSTKQTESDDLDIWPENWRAVQLALAMQTQLRIGMNGPIGYDYNALPVVEARIAEPPPTDREEVADGFLALQCIERELITLIHEKR